MDIKSAMSKLISKDGFDHVWLSPFAATTVGKVASMKWRRMFFIPDFGKFATPESFVAWLLTGDESQRMNMAARIPSVPKNKVRLVKQASLFAKYNQIVTLRSKIKEQKDLETLFTVPWMEYKLHTTGIKEYVVDASRAETIKAMVKHVMQNGPKEPFLFDKFDYAEVKETIMAEVRKNFGLVDIEALKQEERIDNNLSDEALDASVNGNTSSSESNDELDSAVNGNVASSEEPQS